jgi:hypothetical protein
MGRNKRPIFMFTIRYIVVIKLQQLVVIVLSLSTKEEIKNESKVHSTEVTQ